MFGTGTTGFAGITAVLALLTYTVIFALLKSDRQFYKKSQARLLSYLARRFSGSKPTKDDELPVGEEDAESGTEETQAEPRRRRWWKRNHAEAV